MLSSSLFKNLSVKLASLLSVLSLLFTQIYMTQLPARDIYPKAENAIRVMTFNVLSARTGENSMLNRRNLVSQTIAAYYPDSFGVEEATVEWMEWLKIQFPEYGYVGKASATIPLLGGYNAIFYLKDKYEVKESGTFWLSETPDVPSFGWDAASVRNCNWAVLENKQTGKQYAHINTHLDNEGVAARQNSIPMILEKAAGFDIPVVCTGDFNLREGSDYYKSLTSGVLHDTKFLAPDTMDNTTYNGFKPPAEQPKIIIDYILVNNKISPLVYRVITAGIDGRFVSDHYPVYSDVVLDKDNEAQIGGI